MGLNTYSELKASIADYLDRPELTNQIDDFIDLAEARHKREFRIREMLIRSQAVIDSSATNPRFLALPTGFIQMLVFRLLTDEDGNDLEDNVLEEVALSELTRLRLSEVRRPKFFAVHEEFEFDVPPDQDYTVETVYYGEPTPLSDVDPVNALLTRAPDAYLYGALIAATPFILHDERLSMWSDLYGATRDALNKAERRSRHNGPLVARVSGTTP